MGFDALGHPNRRDASSEGGLKIRGCEQVARRPESRCADCSPKTPAVRVFGLDGAGLPRDGGKTLVGPFLSQREAIAAAWSLPEPTLKRARALELRE